MYYSMVWALWVITAQRSRSGGGWILKLGPTIVKVRWQNPPRIFSPRTMDLQPAAVKPQFEKRWI
jgi:hypothetical protein